MKADDLFDLLGETDDRIIAKAKKKTRRPALVRWAALAACICLAAVGIALPAFRREEPMPQAEELPPTFDEGEASASSEDIREFVGIDGMEYAVVVSGEARILQECGLPSELNGNLAGTHICFLGHEDNRYFPVPPADGSEENDIELFAYAPEPSENVYILCVGGEYFAAIRWDGVRYFGPTD